MINDIYIYLGHLTQVAIELWQIHIYWTHYTGGTWAMTYPYTLGTQYRGHINTYRYIYPGHITQAAYEQWQIHIICAHYTGGTWVMTHAYILDTLHRCNISYGRPIILPFLCIHYDRQPMTDRFTRSCLWWMNWPIRLFQWRNTRK